MCGIFGTFLADSNGLADEQSLRQMVQLLFHRGPDTQHIYREPGIGLGHTRLSIIDLDARSNQPMIDPDTRCVITFNGEIYNYLELREQLRALGYLFRTNSDTEVILKAYEHWGIDCLNRFNGMWAFAIYDPRSQQLFAARDRFGIKPFIYGQRQNGDLVFASEAKALFSVYEEFRQPNLFLLTQFLERGNFAGYKQTFFQNLYNLLPGHFFIAAHGEIPQQYRYWTWQPLLMEKNPTDQEALEQFQELFQDSIKLRFRSDVPVGSCLSGGMDSSMIVGMSTRLFGKQLSTFSCVYPDFPDVDESFYIRKSVDHFQTTPHFISPHYPSFIETIRQCIWEQDGPTGGPSVLSQRAVMSLAQGGKVTVLLDGQGADEALGGYHSFFRASLQSYARDFKNHPSLRTLMNYLGARKAVKERSGQIFKHKNILKSIRNKPSFNKETIEGGSFTDSLFPYEADDLNTLMLELMFNSLTTLLHYEDRNSMAFSLESRLPFLDYRLVEFAFSLPHTFIILAPLSKWLLSETAQDILPPEVLNRKDKMGFNTPGQSWFRQPETLPHLERCLFKDNLLRENLPSKMTDSLPELWQKLKNGQPIGTFSGECKLWQYFTAFMFVEQMAGPLPEKLSDRLIGVHDSRDIVKI